MNDNTSQYNLMIGNSPTDTMHNIHDTLHTIKELSENSLDGELNLSRSATMGLQLMLDNIIRAVQYEIERQESQE